MKNLSGAPETTNPTSLTANAPTASYVVEGSFDSKLTTDKVGQYVYHGSRRLYLGEKGPLWTLLVWGYFFLQTHNQGLHQSFLTESWDLWFLWCVILLDWQWQKVFACVVKHLYIWIMFNENIACLWFNCFISFTILECLWKALENQVFWKILKLVGSLSSIEMKCYWGFSM